MTRESLALAAVQSGLLFLAIWIVFRLVPSIPANAKAWIWRLAFLKPVTSLLPFAVVTLHVLPAAPSVPAISSLPISEIVPIAASQYRVEPVPVAPSPVDPLLLVWIIGAAGVALYGVRNWIRAVQVVRRAQPVANFAVQKAFGELQIRAGISVPLRLLSSSEVPSAMLVGGPRPAIVLPAKALASGSPSDIRLMLAHEIAHLARHDLLWFGLIWTVQSLFFFNPLVWLAARCSRLDHESATDRHASQLAKVPIQTYAEMLLRATVVARRPLVPGTVPMAESYRTIHQRLEAMKHFNSQPSFLRKSVIATLALATVGLLPVYQLAQAAPEPQETKPAPVKPKVKAKAKAAKQSKGITLWTKVNGKTEKLYVKGIKEGEWVVLQDGQKLRFFVHKDGKLIPKKVTTPKSGSIVVPKVKEPAPVPPTQEKGVSVRGSGNGQNTGSGTVASGGVAGQNGVPSLEELEKMVRLGGGQGGTRSGTSASSSSSATSTSSSSSSSGSNASSGGGVSGGASGQGSGSFNRSSGGTQESGGNSSSSEVSFSTYQNGGEKIENVNLKAQNADVREVLRALFRHGSKSYEIDTLVQGTVTMSLQNVTFDVALKNIARAVGAEFKLSDGVYVVTPIEKG